MTDNLGELINNVERENIEEARKSVDEAIREFEVIPGGADHEEIELYMKDGFEKIYDELRQVEKGKKDHKGAIKSIKVILDGILSKIKNISENLWKKIQRIFNKLLQGIRKAFLIKKKKRQM